MRYKSQISKLVTCALVVLCSCDDWILFRSTQDYFPLKSGTLMKYEVGKDTIIFEVLGDSVVSELPCIVAIRDFNEEYWIKDKDRIRKFVEIESIRFGEKFPIERRFRIYYELPLIIGNSWTNEFSDTIDILGDTIRFTHKIFGKVLGLDKLSTPAGDFFEVYHLEIIEEFKQNNSKTTLRRDEWFAPGVGLVKRITSNSQEILVEFKN